MACLQPVLRSFKADLEAVDFQVYLSHVYVLFNKMRMVFVLFDKI